ncbi:hypothetical protein LVJ94_03765 [Pendulispora rubella]|uniref:Uncharacterized protein n=1 Tax=Pendulispora rubella TaxID=2741070 RepID=A0ABZ2L6H8_9BACT
MSRRARSGTSLVAVASIKGSLVRLRRGLRMKYGDESAGARQTGALLGTTSSVGDGVEIERT